jgi:threonine dehydrogenase-like Zn-dependent dehydrogenase
MGHEFAGEIVQAGRNVVAFSQGDRVCSEQETRVQDIEQ